MVCFRELSAVCVSGNTFLSSAAAAGVVVHGVGDGCAEGISSEFGVSGGGDAIGVAGADEANEGATDDGHVVEIVQAGDACVAQNFLGSGLSAAASVLFEVVGLKKFLMSCTVLELLAFAFALCILGAMDCSDCVAPGFFEAKKTSPIVPGEFHPRRLRVGIYEAPAMGRWASTTPPPPETTHARPIASSASLEQLCIPST